MRVGNLVTVIAALIAGMAGGSLAGGSGKRIAEGAVVAFQSSSGCPAGWKSYDNARGRFILGASGTEGNISGDVGQIGGGAGETTLSTPDYSDDPSIIAPPAVSSQLNIQSSGSMPPYVILRYCVK